MVAPWTDWLMQGTEPVNGLPAVSVTVTKSTPDSGQARLPVPGGQLTRVS